MKNEQLFDRILKEAGFQHFAGEEEADRNGTINAYLLIAYKALFAARKECGPSDQAGQITDCIEPIENLMQPHIMQYYTKDAKKLLSTLL